MIENEQNLPLISIIIPIYNTKKYLEKCIKSVLNQTYINLEIILINDGSTDGSREIIDFWKKKDNRIHVIHKKNEGLVRARKTGICNAKGVYIAHLDSDDWIEPEMYHDMLLLALEYQADVVTSGLIRDYENHVVIEDEKINAGFFKNKRIENEFWPNIIDINTFFKTNINIHITNKLIKRELALKHQMEIPDSVKIGEDAAVVYPILFDANCVVVSGKNYYHYVMHSASMMNKNNCIEYGSKEIEYRFERLIKEKIDKIPTIEMQLKLVLLYIRLFEETENILNVDKDRLFLFKNLYKNEKIIIYGAGRFGQRVFECIKKSCFCEVIAWCDKVTGEQVVPIDGAIKDDFDKVLIAILISDIADEVEKNLLEKGIVIEKISRMGLE